MVSQLHPVTQQIVSRQVGLLNMAQRRLKHCPLVLIHLSSKASQLNRQ
jgi:hypothetical protein